MTACRFDEAFRRFRHSCEVSAEKSVIQLVILRPNNDLTDYARAIARWFDEARESKRGEEPLCLACERTVGASAAKSPLAFCIAQPHYVSRPEYVAVTGICKECAKRSDDELVEIGMRLLFDNGQRIEEHRA